MELNKCKKCGKIPNFTIRPDSFFCKTCGIKVKGRNYENAVMNWNKENLPSKSILETQVGGSHYKSLKIQPIEFIEANNIPYTEANIIKYVVRHKKKNGIEDLKKAKWYIERLIELHGEK